MASREHILLARVLATMLCAAVSATWMVDPDLWGHLRFGLDIIRDRALHTADPYAFTSDVPWINHEWLSETALGTAYRIGGTAGLLILKVIVVGAAFAVIAHSLRGAGQPGRWWLITAAVVAVSPLVVTVRPQIWTVLALAVLVASAHRPIRERLLWWPLLFLLWANLHGGWLVGLGVVGAHSAGTVLDRRDLRAVPLLVLLGFLCAAATLVTPYGLDLWRFMWDTVGLERDISDWKPLWRAPIVGTVQWLVVVVAIALSARHARFAWAAALPVMMLGLASVKVVRLVGLFGVVAVVLVGRHLPAQSQVMRMPHGITAVIAALSVVPALFVAGKEVRCLSTVNAWGPDLTVAAALAGTSAPGRLMVPFNWGEFAIWHFGPRLKVSMDGRRETVYSPETLKAQGALDVGDPAILPFIERERPDYVWLYSPAGNQLAQRLGERGYREDLRTDRSILVVRGDLPVVAAAAPMRACFP